MGLTAFPNGISTMKEVMFLPLINTRPKTSDTNSNLGWSRYSIISNFAQLFFNFDIVLLSLRKCVE